MKHLAISFLLTIFVAAGYAQTVQITDPEIANKCGTAPAQAENTMLKAGYGYDYTNLQTDITNWKTSPYVWVDTIGTTTQGRNMYMLCITDSAYTQKEYRIWIHARTHPNEVQSTYVTNEIIALLLSDNEQITQLRQHCIFNIVPMYNIDGVELENGRYNANNIDIESNWSATTPEKEVQVLRTTLDSLMKGVLPINIALNMHSAYGSERFFWVHAASGTSDAYLQKEKQFVAYVQEGFPTGIESWDSYVSWNNTAATQYPESWFWYNHQENVLALTYEDMNSTSANSFDITAAALVNGIGKYLEIYTPISGIADNTTTSVVHSENGHIKIIGNTENARVHIFNLQGIELYQNDVENQEITIAHSGLYIVTIQTATQNFSQTIIIQK